MFYSVYWKWLATLLGIAGGIMISLNISDITRYGFIPFLFSSFILIIIAFRMQEMSLVALNATFMVINIIGIYRWLF